MYKVTRVCTYVYVYVCEREISSVTFLRGESSQFYLPLARACVCGGIISAGVYIKRRGRVSRGHFSTLERASERRGFGISRVRERWSFLARKEVGGAEWCAALR